MDKLTPPGQELSGAEQDVRSTYTRAKEVIALHDKAETDAERKRLKEELIKIGHERSRLLKERDRLSSEVNLQNMSSEQQADYSHEMRGADSALDSAIREMVLADNHLQNAREIAFGADITEQEFDSMREALDDLLDNLSIEDQQRVWCIRRAVRNFRKFQENEWLEKTKKDIIDNRTINGDRTAWSKVSWTVR